MDGYADSGDGFTERSGNVGQQEGPPPSPTEAAAHEVACALGAVSSMLDDLERVLSPYRRAVDVLRDGEEKAPGPPRSLHVERLDALAEVARGLGGRGRGLLDTIDL